LNATLTSHPTLKSQHIQSVQSIRKCGRKYVGRQALVRYLHPSAYSQYQAQATNTRNRREQDKDSTLYVGNLAEQATDAQVWELMLQAGPVVNVHLPKDRVTQTHQGYGFVEFGSEEDADYAVKIMNQIRIWGKPIRVNKASADRRNGGPEGAGGLGGSAGVGAELFVGNLDAMVEEKMLFETFSRFGALVAPPKIARDEANLSKGYGFISYSSFDASDDAIANMHGQFLMNKEITVQYAFKKDGKGERHGDQAERALAAQAKKNNVEVAIPAMPASLVMPGNAPTAPAAMNTRPPPSAPQTPYNNYPPGGNFPPPAYGYQNGGGPPHRPSPQGGPVGGFGPPPMGQPGMPGGMPHMPPRQYNQSPLHAPSTAGLPPRPPPSAAGYGGPPAGPPMPFPGGMPGMPPPGGPPGMGAPPPGFPPAMAYPPPHQQR
jgi:splicing factor 3B subunit 4